MYSVIVVGTDGSTTANRAVKHAIELAAMGDATLHIVSAYRPMNATAVKAGTGAETWDLHPRSKVDAILENAAAMARTGGVKVETHAKRTDPADAVIAIAKSVKADAVVVGNQGMKGTKRFLLGSVPSKVAHNAPCSVVIVKTA